MRFRPPLLAPAALALLLALPAFGAALPALPAPASAPAIPAAAPGETQTAAKTLPEVELITPQVEMWPDQIEAEGNVMPWQENSVSTEIGGLRLVSVQAAVGDAVRKGQVLAQLNTASLEAELEGVKAQLQEAEATLAQADATLARAKRLAASGGVSKQDLSQYETQRQTAAARLAAVQAQIRSQQHKLGSATLVAPDDGVISASAATEGEIVQAGSELFRLIRQGRLEWRAEVKGETLLKLAAGQDVVIRSPLGLEIKARVRQVSPTVDMKTRKGFVQVDLPQDANLKAGLFVSGTLTIRRRALALPASALLHQGDHWRVLTVDADNRVEEVEVRIGRSQGGQREILSGLDAQARVIAKDQASLKPGDEVRAAVQKS